MVVIFQQILCPSMAKTYNVIFAILFQPGRESFNVAYPLKIFNVEARMFKYELNISNLKISAFYNDQQ